jgi:hypothetical protein
LKSHHRLNIKESVRQFISYFFTLLALFTTTYLILPTTFQTIYPKFLEPELDEQVRTHFQADIVREEPDIVLLGDSALEVGVNEQTLSTLIDKSVYKIGFDGSGSAVWYLIIKNNLFTSPYKPKTLIIFFRDTMLTTPDFRVTGKYFSFVDELADSKDDLLIQFAYLDGMSLLERMAANYFPLYGERLGVRTALENPFKYGLPGNLSGYDSRKIDHAIGNIFNNANLDPEILNASLANSDNYLFKEENLDFKGKIKRSFLPEIIRLCEEAGIELIFVQVKTLFYSSENSKPSALQAYGIALTRYFSERRIPLIDFSNDPRVSQNWFVDIIHFSKEGKTAFTTLLAEELNAVLEK